MDSSPDLLIANLTETGKMVGRLLLTLLTLGILSLLILGYPDNYFLTTKQTVSVPLAGPTSFKAVLIVLPAILIGLRIHLEIYLKHWHRLEAKRIDHGYPAPDIISPLRHPVLKVFSWFVSYPLVPSAIALLAYKAAVFWEWSAALAGVSFVCAVLLAPITVNRKSYEIKLLFAIGIIIIATFVSSFFGGFSAVFHRPFQLALTDLERTSLERIDFRNAQLSRVNLSGSNLNFAELSNAILIGGDLTGAHLKKANLKGASIMGAELEGANLYRANLEGADLKGAKLEGADLSFAKLEGAKLVDAELKGANLESANLMGANLEGATLSGANLNGAIINPNQLDKACGSEVVGLDEGLSIEPCPLNQ